MNKQPYKWMKFDIDNLILEIKVIPNSSKNIIILENECLKIKLTAPAVDNKANLALINFLSKQLKTPKSSIKILIGHTTKIKKISVPLTSKDKLFSVLNLL